MAAPPFDPWSVFEVAEALAEETDSFPDDLQLLHYYRTVDQRGEYRVEFDGEAIGAKSLPTA